MKPRFNVYDIRRKCDFPPLCYDFSLTDKFLKRDDVMEALGVTGRKWTECDKTVHIFLLGDWLVDM